MLTQDEIEEQLKDALMLLKYADLATAQIFKMKVNEIVPDKV